MTEAFTASVRLTMELYACIDCYDWSYFFIQSVTRGIIGTE